MKDLPTMDLALSEAVRRYCHALHNGDGAALQDLCHPRFLMQWIGRDGQPQAMDKAAFVARVGGRDAAAGAATYDVLTMDVEGGDMAQVKLTVQVPPRVYCDQLGFLLVDGDWRLMTKLFRVADGPAMEV